MSKYFKKFNTHEEYEAYITSESKILPNVSVCTNDDYVYYNPLNQGVTGVTLNKSSLSLSQGASETLVATVSPTSATDKSVTWTSSNISVATVDSNGKVTAVGSGNAIITVTTVDGGFTAQCAASVAVSVTGVTLNKSSLSLEQGTSETLVATVLPSTASNKQVTWTSSDINVATVDSNGKVTAVGGGNATITVTTVDGGFTAQCATSVAVLETKLITKHNVTSTYTPTIIGNGQYISAFTEIEIDGVTQPSVVSAYTFNTTGEHTVKYTLRDTTSIGDYSFSGCSRLRTVEIPNTVTSIGNGAFLRCSGVTSVTIGNSVMNIGDYAFSGCSDFSIKTIVIPNSVTSIGDGAFGSCSWLETVTVGSGVTHIGAKAFYGCSRICSLVIPNGVTRIERETFANCYLLSSITFPNGLTYIGDRAFLRCHMPSDLTIPNTVTSIGNDAFEGCGSVSVTIPNSVTNIGNNVFKASSLYYIHVESGNTVYDSRNNCHAIIETATNTLIAGCRNTKIPNSVTSIGVGAFDGCSGLTSVTIPSSVTSIGEDAFSVCSGLTSVTIPSSVTSIGNSAFSSCSSLISVTIGDGVTKIPRVCFAWCRSLSSVTIGSNVTTLGSQAFDGCKSLTSITIPNNVTDIGMWVFQSCDNLVNIVSLAVTAPSIDNTTFLKVKTGGTLTVPSGSSGYDTWMQNANYYLGLYEWTKVEQ